MKPPHVFVLDQQDSFVHILADQIAILGCEVEVHRADVSCRQLQMLLDDRAADLLVLSPGPGHPRDAEPALGFLRSSASLPVLGVCLGHQTMALACGGEVGCAPRPVHGKRSRVRRVEHPWFDGVPSEFDVGRYHSLCVTRVPGELEVLATTRDGPHDVVMAMAHRTRPWLALQFHPESCLTPEGGILLRNALRLLCPACEREDES